MFLKSNARGFHFETRSLRASQLKGASSEESRTALWKSPWMCFMMKTVGECKNVLSLWGDSDILEGNFTVWHCREVQMVAGFLKSRVEEFTLGKHVNRQGLKRKGQFLFLITI